MNHTVNLFTAKHRNGGLLVCLLLAVGLSACSQTRPQLDQLEATKPISVKYEVQSGDSLVRIAKRLTGNVENWAEIAAINNITEPKSMQVGRVLIIPEYMLPEMAQTQPGSVESTTGANETVTQAPTPETAEKPVFVASSEQLPADTEIASDFGKNVATSRKSRPRKDWIFQASSLPGKLEIPAVVHRAVANRTFEIERTDLDEPTNAANATQTQSVAIVKKIRVVGTYYPKGIYSQPSYTSNLLMRVAPGTQLELEQSFGDWLQIRTEKGSGYIRSIDAEIIGARDSEAMLLSNNG